jgi:acyl-CoA thioester hydrolase
MSPSHFKNGAFLTSFRVYYEDTDAAGIVYYANYLKYAERARTDALRACGIHQSTWLENEGLGFVVRSINVDYHSPACLDDIIIVETCLQKFERVRMSMTQSIMREERVLVSMQVEIAMVNRDRKPARIPEAILDALLMHMTLQTAIKE